MPIKLVARSTIVKLQEVSDLFDSQQMAINYINCLNQQIPTTQKGEYHHIIPKCESSDNSENNIVYVSIDTHFKCHYYLTFTKNKVLKKKMCFAFRQMLQTRQTIKTVEDLDIYATRYKELIEEKIFKENYERTDEIRSQIANKVSLYINTNKPRWINNGIIEKFVPSEQLDYYINIGFVLGRLNKEIYIEKTQVSSTRVHKQKREGTYVPTKKALYKKELRKRKFLELLNSDIDKLVLVSSDGKTFKKILLSDIRKSNIAYRPHCFWD